MKRRLLKILEQKRISCTDCTDDSRFDISFMLRGTKYYVKLFKAGRKCAVTVESASSVLMQKYSTVISSGISRLPYESRDNISLYTAGSKNTVFVFYPCESVTVGCDEFSPSLLRFSRLTAMSADSFAAEISVLSFD